jgi:hypothetical protein
VLLETKHVSQELKGNEPVKKLKCRIWNINNEDNCDLLPDCYELGTNLALYCYIFHFHPPQSRARFTDMELGDDTTRQLVSGRAETRKPVKHSQGGGCRGTDRGTSWRDTSKEVLKCRRKLNAMSCGSLDVKWEENCRTSLNVHSENQRKLTILLIFWQIMLKHYKYICLKLRKSLLSFHTVAH